MTRAHREWVRSGAILLFAVLLIALVRQNLFDAEGEVKRKHDVVFLPPPEQVVTLSLGYRHALADVLWAHVLVAQGIRMHEMRRFDTLLSLYDAINALDPTFRTPYVMADALIMFNVIPTTKDNKHIDKTIPFEEVLKTREILERGTKALPDDPEIWLTLGQYMSFIAPSSYLDDHPDVAEKWRLEGVKYLERAVSLSGDNHNIGWQAIAGGSILRNAGELEASLRFYERAYAVTDDPELKERIRLQIDRVKRRRQEALAKLDETQQAEADAAVRSDVDVRLRFRIQRDWSRADVPFINRNTADALGPPPRPSHCAGIDNDSYGCGTSWRGWAEALERRINP